MTNKVDLFFDLFDEAAMLLVTGQGIDYLEAINRTAQMFCNNEADAKADPETQKRLEEILNVAAAEDFLKEEIRLALELLLIKGFKAENQRLDLMTPDTVNYLISRVVNRKFSDIGNKQLTILDTALGTGNQLQAIANNLSDETTLVGIEKEDLLVKLAASSAELQNNEIRIYFQDALVPVYDLADLVIGDLDSYQYSDVPAVAHPLYDQGVRYFPYLVIASRLVNLKDNGYFIYVIENDFFSQAKVDVFRSYLKDQATLMGLMVLPPSMFKSGAVGKSILIGKKASLRSWNMTVLQLTSLSQDQIPALFQKIDKFTDNL
jgi:site-specific DNA-methyltransferase (adenine-specific)